MRATVVRRGLWDRITSGLAGRRLAGKDLSGNKYYELPNPAGGRTKRVVEYADSSGAYAYSSVDDYRQGTAQLPVQWSAWLSHTRGAPPSMAELQTDAARQTRLRSRVAEIEERERQERIQQGFLLPDGTEPGRIAQQQQQHKGSLHLPSPQAPTRPAPAADTPEWVSADGTPHASSRFAFPPAPDATPVGGGSKRRGSRKRAGSGAVGATAAAEANGAAATPPAASAAPVVPPRPKVDPSATPASELRRLAEEDTRRRLRQAGASEEGTAAGAGPAVAGVGRGLRPKRRGG